MSTKKNTATMKKTERMILYKDMYEDLKKYSDNLKLSVKNNTVTGLKRRDFKKMIPVYTKYYPKDNVNLNCNSCLFKMIQRMNFLMERTEKEMSV